MDDAERDGLLGKLDLRQKIGLLSGATVWRTGDEPAIGLRGLTLSDGPVGVRGPGWDERRRALLLPSPTAIAATWDDGLVRELGALLGGQARAAGVHVVLAPTLNLHRSPLGGRHFECFSEDPVLAGRTGAAFVRGVQARGVGATAKHYVANESETDRLTADVRVDERTLREVYLAPFEEAVAAGVWLVMSAYNAVNGATMTASGLLASPLKDGWGFDGVVVSDWGAVRDTVPSAAAAQDLAMPGPETPWGERLERAVLAGEVAHRAVDDKVRRLLRLADRVGALQAPGAPPTAPRPPAPAAHARDRALLRRAVAAGAVLLSNDGTLPLDRAALRTVAVVGRHAASPRVQGGGSAEVFPEDVVPPLDALRDALGPGVRVVYAPGPSLGTPPPPLDTATARDPRTGEPGVLLRVLDTAGNELHAEHRLSGRQLEPPLPPGAHTVELSATVSAPRAGEWTLGVAGFGRLGLRVDGRTLLDEDQPRHTDDPALVHVRPPARHVRVALPAAREALVVATRELAPDTGRATVLSAAPPEAPEDAALAEAVAVARDADAAVVVVGTTTESESEGHDRDTLRLPGRQDDLVRAVAAAQPRTVAVLNAGGPVALPWRAEAAAVLLAWFPGQEAGPGLADVLLGRAEPGGRLPTTWPADLGDAPVTGTRPRGGVLDYEEGVHTGYRAWLRAGTRPAYWFGHGLGYTTWEYQGMEVRPLGAEEGFEARVRVRNTGVRPGREVVQVYLSRPGGEVERPARWLAGYTAVTAAPGERADAVVRIPPRALRHWSCADGGWQVEAGCFEVLAGRSAGSLPLAATLETTEEIALPPRGPGR